MTARDGLRRYVSRDLHRPSGRAVYVLHAFQKKSRQGIATPPQEIARVRQRLAALIEEREKQR